MIEILGMLQEKTKGNLLEPGSAAHRRSPLRAADALRPGPGRREAHHPCRSPRRASPAVRRVHLEDHIPRDRHLARRADDRLRLRDLHVAPIRGIARLRTSVLIATDDDGRLLVDAGPDLRAQALAHDIRRLDAILFTHGHADHILGLDEVRRYNTLQRRPMACYGDASHAGGHPPHVRVRVRSRRPAGGGGRPRSSCSPCVGPFCVGRQEVQPVQVDARRRGRFSGYRLGGFAYLTDCSAIPDESWPLLEGLDVLVLDALRDQAAPDAFLSGRGGRGDAPDRAAARVLHPHLPRPAARRDLRAPAAGDGAGL